MQVSPAHWHLLFNHFPIILVMTGALFLSIGLILNKDSIKSTALLIVILAGLTALIANTTGEGAEEQLEGVPGVSAQSIETHEESAKTGLTIILITGAVALISAFVFHKNKKTGHVFVIISLVGAFASSAFMGYVGLTGGEIRHSEIRGDFGRSAAPDGGNSIFQEAGEGEAEEDD